jgi:hypothetical protein
MALREVIGVKEPKPKEEIDRLDKFFNVSGRLLAVGERMVRRSQFRKANSLFGDLTKAHSQKKLPKSINVIQSGKHFMEVKVPVQPNANEVAGDVTSYLKVYLTRSPITDTPNGFSGSFRYPEDDGSESVQHFDLANPEVDFTETRRALRCLDSALHSTD